MERPDKKPPSKPSKVFRLVHNVGLTTLFHPVEYAKVLIQIGHEPIRPYAGRTFLGRPVLRLPGLYRYISHIKSVDGFFGLYNGLVPRICSNIVCSFAFEDIVQRLPDFLEPPPDEDEKEEELSEERKFRLFLQRAANQTIASCFASIASYPLQVIAVRTMAQFVGKEDYGGLFGMISHISNEEGIKGFFSGLIPKLIGEVCTIWLMHTSMFVINTYILHDKAVPQQYIEAGVSFMARTITYPFTLVSTVMAVNNCGLAAGAPPDVTTYLNWRDCWTHLKSQGHLQRGSSILFRYYTGPVMVDSSGNLTAVDRKLFKSPRPL